jgi:hypothetical protein
MKDYKEDEIREFALEQIEYIKEDLNTYNQLLRDGDLHHEIFNTDYYVVYTGDAIEWLEDNTFRCIERIKEYEEFNFGSVSCDFSDPVKIVNMYVYVVGEKILQDLNLQPEWEDEEEE